VSIHYSQKKLKLYIINLYFGDVPACIILFVAILVC